MHYEDEHFDIGSRLGTEAVEHITQAAERYCGHEQERIALVNEPRLNALQAEGHDLGERCAHLEERLRTMPPPQNARSEKRRVWYYSAIGIMLMGAAFAFTLIGFAPYRLGRIGTLYCAGIALVTPFAVDEFLKVWKGERALKAIVAAVFVTALLGGAFLAVIRGDLLARKAEESSPAVVIEGDAPPQPAETKKSFYEENEIPLRFMMLFLALAMDLGAGVALHLARTTGVSSSGEYEAVAAQLGAVRLRLYGIIFEITALRNGPAVFGARFWRNFYRAMLTQTVRNGITRGSLIVLFACAMWSGRASAGERVDVVAALDLSNSEAAKRTDQKSPFEKNVDGIARLISTLPPGSRITVISITEDSIADPRPLLTAELSADSGYFGERLAAGRAQLVRAWRSRAAPLAPTANGTDIIGALHLASEIFRQGPEWRRILVIFSDMRNVTGMLNLEVPLSAPLESTLTTLGEQGQIPNLGGVTVYIVGANGGGRPIRDWQAIREFWIAFLRRAGATCGGYSILPAPPSLAQ